ncbi:diguanylate cyclase [Salinispirillum sp. LH 10-3-1]|uniref:diguanylate cyclase n=1 Tax=Salinispirillum sp. LH 10-3-1 TaxID=2952525 RepID=A0AB38YCD5_9GAMM
MTELRNEKQMVKELQRHFGRRVISDARGLVDQWYGLRTQQWQEDWFTVFCSRLLRLEKSAQRYDQPDIAVLAAAVRGLVNNCSASRAPQSNVIAELADYISQLTQLAARHSDSKVPGKAAFIRQDVYVAIEQPEMAQAVVQQLLSFGIQAELTPDPESLQKARAYRRPLAILIDMNFHGVDGGFNLIRELQHDQAHKIPVIFYHKEVPSIMQRLQAMRVGGKGFIDNDLSLMRVVERLERDAHTIVPDPYRVLIVDDSKTQSMHAGHTLNAVGIITQAVLDPMTLFEHIDEFRPDMILMDMYMPQCNGVELATVLRQQPQYDRLPIIFLSAEEDVAKQMAALAEGGDDFLTKPVRPEILVATVQHRCKRNRAIRTWMERDSLTGLYDHSHILQRLQVEVQKAERQKSPLSFVMIDLDKFKTVNDTYGHPVGDRVLKSLSLLLRQRLRKTDIIGRYGGEEFVVIMPETPGTDAALVMQDMLQAFIEVRHPVGEGDINCSFSVGVAELLSGEAVSSLSVRADEALYTAKENGRSRIELAS